MIIYIKPRKFNLSLFQVKEITQEEIKPWLLEKHYAKILPSSIRYRFGLFYNEKIYGVCCFATGARAFNNSSLFFDIRKCKYIIPIIELARLVVLDNLPKNVLSRFVSLCLKRIKENPCCIVSYADSNMTHHGYIYQATNWIYTGITGERRKFIDNRTKKNNS